MAASTLIYALVFWISSGKWSWPNDLMNYFFGPFQVAVVVGSLLLPFTHRVLFQRPAPLAWKTALLLIASFYAVTLISFINDKHPLGFHEQAFLGFHLNFITLSIAIWQWLYLALFFRKE